MMFGQMKVISVQNGSVQGVLNLNEKNTKDAFQNLLFQIHLPQLLEIWYVVLVSGSLLNLFKLRSQRPKWFYHRKSWFPGSKVK